LLLLQGKGRALVCETSSPIFFASLEAQDDSCSLKAVSVYTFGNPLRRRTPAAIFCLTAYGKINKL
jgi:hypothetical protein